MNMKEMNLIEKLKHARRVSVPMVAVRTVDQQACAKRITRELNGSCPVVLWDVLRGTNAVNDKGRPVAKLTGDGEDDVTIGNPTNLLVKALDFPADTVVLAYNWDQFLKDDAPGVIQGMANLRDRFKSNGRMLVMLAPDLTLPASLKDDVVVLDDPLPTEEELTEIVVAQDKAACESKTERKPLDADTVRRAVEAVTGISAFAAEQVIAMALRSVGIDLDHVWASKKVVIEQTKGLSIYRKDGKFADLGGLDQAKTLLTRLMRGRRKFRVVVWLDEIGTTGLANRGDSAGVNSSTEGTLLSYMEDSKAYGVMLVGVPGCGKSALCKSMAEEFDVVVIRLDLEALQGSLVGQSQQNLRAALGVIEAVGGKDALWLATANSIDGLSAAMRSRYTDTMFFDSPTADEREPIWQVWLDRMSLKDEPHKDDDGWVGRDICHCCEKAWAMGIPVAEAAQYVIPASTVEREAYATQRAKADGRYLSASKPGVYRAAKSSSETDGARQLSL
jgi:hypothetical protein